MLYNTVLSRHHDHIKHIIRKHILMVKAYDDKGKTATESIEVFAIFL